MKTYQSGVEIYNEGEFDYGSPDNSEDEKLVTFFKNFTREGEQLEDLIDSLDEEIGISVLDEHDIAFEDFSESLEDSSNSEENSEEEDSKEDSEENSEEEDSEENSEEEKRRLYEGFEKFIKSKKCKKLLKDYRRSNKD